MMDETGDIEMVTMELPRRTPESDDDFHAWLRDFADKHAPVVQSKAAEYGTNSLAEMGLLLARASGRPNLPEREALELGAFVYVYGKVQRVADAVLRGGLPAADAWLDTAIYSLMVLYIRDRGRWP
jgi:hypothetical protein